MSEWCVVAKSATHANVKRFMFDPKNKWNWKKTTFPFMHWHFFRLRTLIYLFKLVICISGDLSNACTGQYFPTRKWKWKSDRKWCPKLSHTSYLRLISFALFLHILTTLLFRTCICMIAQREKKVGDICFKRRIVWTLSKSTETHVDVLCLLLFEQMLRKRQVKQWKGMKQIQEKKNGKYVNTTDSD